MSWYSQDVPTSDDHDRTCMHYRTFGDQPCDCGGDQTMADLGGGMVVPLSELLDDDD